MMYSTPSLSLPSNRDDLYHRGVDTILRRCLTHAEAEQVLNACHSGACGGHLSGLTTAQLGRK